MVDAYIEEMKSARSIPAVLKLCLLDLRGRMPNCIILAFEGDDDKIVYAHWIRRIRPEFFYEPFPCNGKDKVLELRNIVARDLNDLGRGIYYFIDRDFDDYKGHAAAPNTYMIDTYSVENYLVSDHVLSELLTNEFHCHAHPHVRTPIIALFNDVYRQFLLITLELNWRIYVARQLNIEIQPLTNKARHIATIKLDTVEPAIESPDSVIVFAREPSDDELKNIRPIFENLTARDRFRGKFAYFFFTRWLELLAEEHAQPQMDLFKDLNTRGRVRRNELSLNCFASKSILPTGLPQFINAMPATI